MLSKNNYKEKLQKMKLKKDRFSIRKFTVGAASVLIGFTFMGAVNSQEVKADTKPVSPEPSPAANEDKGEQKQSDAGAVQAEAETVDPNAHVETERVETQDNQAANVQTATDKENTLKVNSNVDTSAITTEAAKEEKTEASINLDNERTFKRTINVELPKGRHYADGSNKQSIQQSVQFGRTANIDQTTGKVVSYDNWKAANNEGTDIPANKWDPRDVSLPGYTAKAKTADGQNYDLINGTVVPGVKFDANKLDQYKDLQNKVINITYKANEVKRTIDFVNKDNETKVVGHQSVLGLTGTSAKYSLDGDADGKNKLNVPEGWESTYRAITIPFNGDASDNDPVKIPVVLQIISDPKDPHL